MTTVRELMHEGLITCTPGTELARVAELLRRHDIHAVIVADESNRPAGIVSDTDLLAGEWLGNTPENLSVLRRMTAGELMSTPLVSIAASSTASEAAAEIRRLHVARLLVTEDSVPIGVISISDLLGALPRSAPERKTVRDVMSWGFVACRPNTPYRGAVRAMHERDSRSLLVIDEGGGVAGVVTGFDLLGVLSGETPADGEIGLLMKPPITIGPDASLQEAVKLMLDKSIHRLVVVDSAAPQSPPLGLISTTDVMVEMALPDSAWH
jgi:CBS domain-containing protein